jgi:hypothetical protein
LFLCTGKGRERVRSEKALWKRKRAKHKSAVMWEALRREDLLVTDKEEACIRLAQLPCTRKRDTEELLVGMLESLRVKCRARR